MRIEMQYKKMNELLSPFVNYLSKNRWIKLNKHIAELYSSLPIFSLFMFVSGYWHTFFCFISAGIVGGLWYVFGNKNKYAEIEHTLREKLADDLYWYTFMYINKSEGEPTKVWITETFKDNQNVIRSGSKKVTEYDFMYEGIVKGGVNNAYLQHRDTKEKIYVLTELCQNDLIIDTSMYKILWHKCQSYQSVKEGIDSLKQFSVKTEQSTYDLKDKQVYQFDKGLQSFLLSDECQFMYQKEIGSIVDVIEIVSYCIAMQDIQHYDTVLIKYNRFCQELYSSIHTEQDVTVKVMDQSAEQRVQKELLALGDREAKYLQEKMRSNELNEFMEGIRI